MPAPIYVDRVERVSIDHPNLRGGLVGADVSVWRTPVGFECFASFGGRIYHGVSADGRWLVLDRYPVIASGARPSVAVWRDQFYVFYHDEEAPLHQSPRLAHGMDRHSFVSVQLEISGIPRNEKAANFSVIQRNENWLLFFELTRAHTARIAYADSHEPAGPWIMRDVLSLADQPRKGDCATVVPSALVASGNILLFYSALGSRSSQIGCARVVGETLRVEDNAFIGAPRSLKSVSVTCALQWGTHIYAYARGQAETCRITCSAPPLV